MRRRDVSLTVAVCASLLAHGGVALLAVEGYGRSKADELAWFGKRGWGVGAGQDDFAGGSTLVNGPLLVESEVVPQVPQTVVPPARSLPQPSVEQAAYRPSIGDEIGGGVSATRSPGEQELKARQNRQAQADLGLSVGQKKAGGGGDGGNPGGGAEASAAASPPAAAAARAPVGQRPGGSEEGLLKEGATAGVDTQKTPPQPKVEPAALPAAVEARVKALAEAEVAKKLVESRGKAGATAAEAALPDARGNATAADARPVGQRAETQDRAGVKVEGGREKGNGVGLVGRGDVRGGVLEKTAAREEAASARRESPAGDVTGRQDERRDGVTEAQAKTGEAQVVPPKDVPAGEAAKEVKTEADKATEKQTPAEQAGAAGQAAPARQVAIAETGQQVSPEEKSLRPQQAQAAASQAAGQAAGPGGGGDARAPGNPGAEGDSSVRSDSESDPFTKVGTVRFQAGRVDARFGRKVKWVKPRLTLAGQIDASVSGAEAIVLAVSIDHTGKVIKVEVLRSSGSPDSVDLPVVRAVYAWWIEPLKNSKGEPLPDTMIWRIELRG